MYNIPFRITKRIYFIWRSLLFALYLHCMYGQTRVDHIKHTKNYVQCFPLCGPVRTYACLFVFFVCLFGFIIPLENISLIWRRHHCRWRAAILTYARHLWPYSSEGSLACHAYYDTVHPFIMVIFEDPWHSYLLPSVWQWNCHLFYDLDLSRLGFEHPTLHLPAGRTWLHGTDCNYIESIVEKKQSSVSSKELFYLIAFCDKKRILYT